MPVWSMLSVLWHYGDVIMGTMASRIARLTIVYSTVYPGADQRKHQSFASLACVRKKVCTAKYRHCSTSYLLEKSRFKRTCSTLTRHNNWCFYHALNQSNKPYCCKRLLLERQIKIQKGAKMTRFYGFAMPTIKSGAENSSCVMDCEAFRKSIDFDVREVWWQWWFGIR